LLAFEQVDVYDITNGARFTTYVIYGAAGEIQVNGAAARLVATGDLIIVAGYCRLAENEIPAHRARVVLMGPGNAMTGTQEHAVTPP
jgi:aspartate 1-decarboxylase